MTREQLIEAVGKHFETLITNVETKALLENNDEVRKAVDDPDPDNEVTEADLNDCIQAFSDNLQLTLDVLKTRIDF